MDENNGSQHANHNSTRNIPRAPTSTRVRKTKPGFVTEFNISGRTSRYKNLERQLLEIVLYRSHCSLTTTMKCCWLMVMLHPVRCRDAARMYSIQDASRSKDRRTEVSVRDCVTSRLTARGVCADEADPSASTQQTSSRARKGRRSLTRSLAAEPAMAETPRTDHTRLRRSNSHHEREPRGLSRAKQGRGDTCAPPHVHHRPLYRTHDPYPTPVKLRWGLSSPVKSSPVKSSHPSPEAAVGHRPLRVLSSRQAMSSK